MPLPTTACAGRPCSDSPRSVQLAGRRLRARDRLQQRALAGAVRAQHRDELALADAAATPPPAPPPCRTHTDKVVASQAAWTASSAGRRCRGRCRPRSPPDAGRSSSGVPSAITSPKSSAMTRLTRRMNSRSLCSISTTVSPSSACTLSDQRRQVVDLAAAQPGERFVQQQQRRARGERARDLQPPLVAVRQHLHRNACPCRPGRPAPQQPCAQASFVRR